MVDREKCWSCTTARSNDWIHGVRRALYFRELLLTQASANDLRYLVVLAATLKAGYVPLFTSPRNSLDGQKFLVEKTDCNIFLTSAETAPQVETIRKEVPQVRVFTAPTTQELLDPNLSVPPYPGKHSRNVSADSLILHTSGSTGMWCHHL